MNTHHLTLNTYIVHQKFQEKILSSVFKEVNVYVELMHLKKYEDAMLIYLIYSME